MRTGTRLTTGFLLSLSLSLVLFAVTASAARADIVYLNNGRSFDGVVADESDGHVKLQIEGGSLTLPRSSVARIQKADSSLAELLRRKSELRREGAGAQAWLDLARWADGMGLASGARDAALTAAAIDPQLPGLDRELRAQNYLYDSQLGRWIPYADEMRRRGMVLDENGDWVTRQEHAARLRERSDALQLQQMVLAQQEAAQADLLRAQAEMYGNGGPGAGPSGYDAGSPFGYGFNLGYGYGGFVSPGHFSPGFRRHEFRRGAPFRPFRPSPFPNAHGFHQPGSLIQSHQSHGSFVPITPAPPAPHAHVRGPRR
jgi:hypothetical protein